MANVKLSQLPLTISPLDSAAVMPVVQGGYAKLEMEQAIKDVAAGHVERTCAPGLWVVWRNETGVHKRVMQ